MARPTSAEVRYLLIARRLITRFGVAVSVAAVVLSLSAGAVLAGEAQGPPGTPGDAFSGSGNRTGAPAHSNSICSYNGLNDMNPAQGPIDSFVQTPHTQGTFPGEAGHGTCAGGTNPENPPTP
jgi:hypothetical protein